MGYERTPEHRRKHSEVMKVAMKAWWAIPENRARMRLARLGHPVSQATKEKIRHSNSGRKRTSETCERIRRANLIVMENPKARERLQEAGRLTPEQRARQRASVTRTMRRPEMREKQGAILNSPATREKLRRIMQTPEYREKMRQNIIGRKFSQKMTDIERLLLAEFQKRRLHFEMNKPMFGGWICDFVFEQAQLIVEADGEYWHSRPERQKSDQRLIETAETNGWNVFRFSGTEIKQNAAGCAKAVARFIHSKRE